MSTTFVDIGTQPTAGAVDTLIPGGVPDTTTQGIGATGTTNTTTPGVTGTTGEVQTITIRADGGTFTVTYDGQTTAPLAFDISAADLQTALEGLSTLDPGDVVVTGGPGDINGSSPYILTFDAALGDVPEVVVGGGGLTSSVGEVQTITIAATGGTFTVTYDGQTTGALAYNIAYADLQAALEGLSNLVPGDVVVTGGPGDATGSSPYVLTFSAALGDVPEVTVDDSLLTTTGGEVQIITITASEGTFTITFDGQTTPALAYNISAGDLQTALENLSNIAPGDVVVTGGPGSPSGSTPYILTWDVALGDVPEPTVDGTFLDYSAECDVSFEELVSQAGDYSYGSVSVTFAPFTTAGTDLVVSAPYYSYSSAGLAPVLSDAYILVGGVAQVDVSLLSLVSQSGNYPYGGSSLPPGLQPGGDGAFVFGEAGSYLHPLMAYGYDPGAPDTGLSGNTIRTEFMPEIIFALTSDDALTENTLTISSSITATPSLTGILLGTEDMEESVTATATLSPEGTYILTIAEVVQVQSSAGRDSAYIAWVVNQNNAAPSMYTNYNFNSMIQFKGRVLAAGPSGVFSVAGSDDNGTPIVASILMGKDDFDNPFKKYIPEFFLGVEAEGELHVKVTTDDGRSRTYAAKPISALHTRRVQIGKKLLSRYWQFEVTNPDGGAFTMDTVELIPSVTGRRR